MDGIARSRAQAAVEALYSSPGLKFPRSLFHASYLDKLLYPGLAFQIWRSSKSKFRKCEREKGNFVKEKITQLGLTSAGSTRRLRRQEIQENAKSESGRWRCKEICMPGYINERTTLRSRRSTPCKHVPNPPCSSCSSGSYLSKKKRSLALAS